MGTQANPYPLRIDKKTMDKFKILSKENGRSINKEIESMLKKYISAYEKEHGEIILNTNLDD